MASFGLMAQESSKPKPYDQFKIDLFSEIWMGAPDSANMSALAPGFAIGFLKDLPINEHFSFAAGLQFRSAHIYGESQMTSITDTIDTYTVFADHPDTLSLDKSKFATHGFELPIEFRWRSDKNASGNHWKIAVGASLGYNVSAYTKARYGGYGQVRNYIFDDYNKFHYGAHLRLGVAGVGIFANYQFSPVFSSDRSADIVPLTVGVTLLPR